MATRPPSTEPTASAAKSTPAARASSKRSNATAGSVVKKRDESEVRHERGDGDDHEELVA
jgi:hypothetical protein